MFDLSFHLDPMDHLDILKQGVNRAMFFIHFYSTGLILTVLELLSLWCIFEIHHFCEMCKNISLHPDSFVECLKILPR